MKPSQCGASRASISDSAFNPRFMTHWIPPRLRGVTLLVGIVVLFPVIVGAIVLDALTQDMPRVRTPLKKALLAASDWVRAGSAMFRAKRVTSPLPFAGLIEEQSSLAS